MSTWGKRTTTGRDQCAKPAAAVECADCDNSETNLAGAKYPRQINPDLINHVRKIATFIRNMIRGNAIDRYAR